MALRPRTFRLKVYASIAVACGAVLWSGLALAALTAPTLTPLAHPVVLADDDGGAPMFDARSLAPGDLMQRCIAVSIEQGAPADVRVTASGSGTAAEFVDVDIDQGTGGAYSTCAGFRGDDLFSGTLAELLTRDPRGEGIRSWSPARDGETRTYRITARLRDVPAAQSSSAEASFAWHGSPAGAGPIPSPAPTGAAPPSSSPAPSPAPAPAPAPDVSDGRVPEPSPKVADDARAPAPAPGSTARPGPQPAYVPAGAGGAAPRAVPSATGAPRERQSRTSRRDPAGRGSRSRGQRDDRRNPTAAAAAGTERRATGIAAALHRAMRTSVRALEKAARAVAPAAERAAFPALLGLVVFLFLVLQDVLDRRDPKLAQAPLRRAAMLSFSPPAADEIVR